MWQSERGCRDRRQLEHSMVVIPAKRIYVIFQDAGPIMRLSFYLHKRSEIQLPTLDITTWPTTKGMTMEVIVSCPHGKGDRSRAPIRFLTSAARRKCSPVQSPLLSLRAWRAHGERMASAWRDGEICHWYEALVPCVWKLL